MYRQSSEYGNALIEIAVSAAVLSIILLSGVVFFGTTMDVQNDLLYRDLLEEKVRKTTQRVVNLLREARLDTLSDVPESPEVSTSIVFQRVTVDTLTQVADDTKTNLDDDDGNTRTSSVNPYEDAYLTSNLELADGEERISFTDSKLDIESNDSLVTLGRDISLVTFSREGRGVLVTIHAQGKGADGEIMRITRSTHVTLQN